LGGGFSPGGKVNALHINALATGFAATSPLPAPPMDSLFADQPPEAGLLIC
jgi:hypothetical protein